MKQPIVTEAIVLSRIDYQEADRILTVLTPQHGKVRVIAKGARRQKSKLAGGIELFSLCNLSISAGRGDLRALVSSRMERHFGDITKDITRTMYGYELLKQINAITEDEVDEEYYTLLRATLEGLNERSLDLGLTRLWSGVQLLSVTGHMPNLRSDTAGNALRESACYHFDYDAMALNEHPEGLISANHIKLLRLCSATPSPTVLLQVQDAAERAGQLLPVIQSAVRQTLRV